MNEWINFVLYAVLGKMREADAILRDHRQSVLNFAALLEARFRASQIETRPHLYRGVLCETRPMTDSSPGMEFVSWTEDLRLAQWFAHPDSFMSVEVKRARPGVEGWLMSTVSPAQVLFHWRWAKELPFVALGELHPHIAPQVDQLAWNLQTQQEVICVPGSEVYMTAPLDGTVEELDKLFTCPGYGRRT